jgi:hypothetical protein
MDRRTIRNRTVVVKNRPCTPASAPQKNSTARANPEFVDVAMKPAFLTCTLFRITALALAALLVPFAAQAAWMFDLGFEGDASDSSGAGNNGSILGGAAFVMGIVGQALALANRGGAGNQGVKIPASASLSWNVFALAH